MALWVTSRPIMVGMGKTGVSCGLGVAVVRDKLRSFALSLPEALEDHPWGEDVVKVRGKIFVFLGSASSRRMTVKLEESHSHALSIDGAAPTGYGLGTSGWVTVPLRADGITIALLRDWVEESYRIVAPKRLLAEIDAAL
jgi:predicted DNA-binding protein (MmcQ/YjbR family)